MNIIIGRGNNREIISLPCAAIVKAAPEQHQKAAVALICDKLGIKGKR